MDSVDILGEVNRVFDIEISELMRVKALMDNSIINAIEMVNNCSGKVAICGMGKPGHIAKKMSASFSSMGIPSFTIHPAEAQHGDLGALDKNDIIILISNSGETAEVCNLLPNLKLMGIPTIAITEKNNSTLGKLTDCVIATDKIAEAGNLKLAPTSSTTVELVIGDAIAVVVSKMRNFKKENFALFHPAGTLGKKLLTTVKELMHKEDKLPCVGINTSLVDAIAVMNNTGLGAVLVVNEVGILTGIITDGDLKRLLSSRHKIPKNLGVKDVMTKNPISINQSELAVEALKIMENREKVIHCIAVVDNDNKAVGLIRNHDVINAGIFI